MEFAILSLFMKHAAAGGMTNGAHEGEAKPRAVFLTPIERSVAERFGYWAPRFRALGFRVACLTGHASQDLKILEESQLILGTPDKFDNLTRRWRQKKAGKLLDSIGLLLCDELHLLE